MPDYNYCVSLRIFHPTVHPNEITEALNISPKQTHIIGEPRTSLKGKLLGGINESSYWVVDFHDLIKSGGYIEYFIGWFGEGTINMGITLEVELLLSIAELQIAIGLNAYPE